MAICQTIANGCLHLGDQSFFEDAVLKKMVELSRVQLPPDWLPVCRPRRA
jgi:hypothetical protein